MSTLDPATKQDVERAIKEAISDLKLYVVERESSWLKWVVGIQISYFAITLGVVYFAVHVR